MCVDFLIKMMQRKADRDLRVAGEETDRQANRHAGSKTDRYDVNRPIRVYAVSGKYVWVLKFD